MPLTRAQLANIYRPLSAKVVSLGNLWASGGSLQLSQALDLSQPLRGLRFVFKGRLVVGTAAFTSVNPEGFLNLLPAITIQGVNKRQQGNVTLFSGSLATLFALRHMFRQNRSDHYDIGGTLQTKPTMPYPSYFSGSIATFDWRIAVDYPFHPFDAPEGVRPGFLMRQEEWLSSVQLLFTYGTQAGAGATGALGVSAATTTVTFSALGGATGSPTLDIYSLPVLMGLDLKDTVLPGFLSRVTTPISTILQTSGTGVQLLPLQKLPTTRIYTKVGTSSVVAGVTYFATLSDSILTGLGLIAGGTRNVRYKTDVFAQKQELIDAYGQDPVQGFANLDFLSSRNPDSAYPGAFLGDGTTLSLVGDVTASGTGYGEVIQEMMPWAPTGPLYTF